MSVQSKYSFVTRGLYLDKRAGITTLEPVPKRVQENHSWITSFRLPVWSFFFRLPGINILTKTKLPAEPAGTISFNDMLVVAPEGQEAFSKADKVITPISGKISI